ncbi:MAG: hypothetical protein V3U37_02355 [Nitrospinaceae bacterium]
MLWILLSASPLQAQAELPEKRMNPFLLPQGVFSTSNLPPADPVPLILQAIITSGTKKIATINNQNFSQGDIIFGKKIVEILSDRVILDDRGIRVPLVLKQPFFPVKVSNKP